jgi:hypothetical protein
MILMRIVFIILLFSGFCQPALAGAAVSQNPTQGVHSGISATRSASESVNTERKTQQFIDEDGDGINDIVEGQAGFSNSKAGEGSCYGYQSGYRMFTEGGVGNGAGRGSGAHRRGSRR